MIVKDLIPGMGAKVSAIMEKPWKTRPARRFPAETGTSGTGRRRDAATRRACHSGRAAPASAGKVSAHGDDHLAGGQAFFHDLMSLDDILEAEDAGGLGPVPPGLGVGDHFLQRDA